MTKQTSWDDESNVVQSAWIKFNVPGEDKVVGTLIRKRQIKSTLPGEKNGKMMNVYDLAVDEGSFHALDKKKKLIAEPIVINAGDVYSLSKESVDIPMMNVKIGQKVGFKFVSEQENKVAGYNAAKIIKVFTPKNDDGSYKMDEEFVANGGADQMGD